MSVVQVLIAGGNSEYCANAETPGGTKSWLFDVSPGANHSLIEETTAFPRVVGQSPRAECWILACGLWVQSVLLHLAHMTYLGQFASSGSHDIFGM